MLLWFKNMIELSLLLDGLPIGLGPPVLQSIVLGSVIKTLQVLEPSLVLSVILLLSMVESTDLPLT
jgi:hypothetical protein